MNITLYVNKSEKNKIGKNLTNDLSLSGTLRDTTNIINPIILVELNEISNYNYCHIPNFNRYYFITDITVIRTGLYAISLLVDVLESFKTDIKNLSVILLNTQNSGVNNYLPSPVFRNNVKSKTDIINFPNGLNDSGEFILITAGG
nr:MAG TPA: hypothetical protein [Caudoviricetes sp.]